MLSHRAMELSYKAMELSARLWSCPPGYGDVSRAMETSGGRRGCQLRATPPGRCGTAGRAEHGGR